MECWNEDAIYALSSYRPLACPLGVWPIEDETVYKNIRWLFAMISEVSKIKIKFTFPCKSIIHMYVY